ncbi:urease accessory protein UreD [Aspergillus brunneoviolaceus CBS 621.78]|uniref:Urease accessory protein UreD n=1 Tax=Aspergillus brunneoviolaceus CBS 621.78 TaxID=1450534 RepID=A0ACD1GL01_9EURO|nr:urease accessory protein UreD [Aspergillus brunneoviolaceus CBS 621.78]RAH49822.1 urease accessory protein UreD [Aspergillus brunneoviolaceus CBS 621.78]
MPIKSPFESCIAKPGEGKVVLSLLPPSNPTLTTLTYKYPLKLLTRTPGFVPKSSALICPSQPVHLYLLTYGGGLLPGDKINVSITLDPRTRMVVTTPQGSTKIFKTEPNASVKGQRGTPKHILSDKSSQHLTVHVGQEAALCYLPDPAVPYKDSRYEQVQTFTIDGPTSSKDPHRSSLCILDWVTQGRASRGENWDFHLWRGKNEVWTTDESGKKKLLLRDSLILDRELDEDQLAHDPELLAQSNLIRERTYPHGVVGTLILYGPVFENLANFFMNRFTSLPRIGARNWSSPAVCSSSAATEPAPNFDSQVTFTAARVRAGFVLVKFGAPDFAAAKDWLGAILREEGTVYTEFGEEALFCL